MADGSLIFDTNIDNSGFNTGMTNLVSVAAKGAAAIATAIGVASAAAAKVGSDYEAAMSQVAATMGITSADKEFAMLSTAAQHMGATTKYSASEAAEALNYLALAGYDTQKSISTLPTILNVAASDNMGLAAAADLVTNAMTALGLSTEYTAEFADQLAIAAQKSNASVSQLGEGILTVGGTAKDLSGGVIELATNLGILADNGIKGAEGGTALRNIILSLSAPTAQAAETMQNLGISAFDASGKFKPLETTFAEINSIITDMSTEDKNVVLSEIFNKVDLKSVNALMGTSSARFKELSGYIADCDGAAEQMSATMQDNLQGDITTLKSGLEATGIAAYEKFQVPLRTAVQSVTEDISELSESISSGELSESFIRMSESFAIMMETGNEFLSGIALPTLSNALSLIAENSELIRFNLLTVILGLPAGIAVQAYTAANAEANASIAAGAAIYAESAAAVEKMAESYYSAVRSAEELAGVRDEEISQIAALKKRIDENIDANGTIVKNYAETVELISQLNDLYPEEISVIDGKIQGYNDLSAAIENYLVNLEKETLYNSKKEKYSAAVVTYDSAVEEQDVLMKNFLQADTVYKEALKKYDWYKSGINRYTAADKSAADEAGMSIGDYMKDQYLSAQSAWQTAVQSLETNKSVIADAERDMADFRKYITENNVMPYGSQIAENEKRKYAAGVGIYESPDPQAVDTTEKLYSEWKRLEHDYVIGHISSEADLYKQKRQVWNEYGDASLEDHWRYYEDLCSYDKSFADEQLRIAKENAENQKVLTEQAIAEQENAVDSGLSKIVRDYQNAFDELESKRQAYRNKLLSIGGDIFSVDMTKGEDGREITTYRVNDLDEQLKRMQDYHRQVTALKERGASSELLVELTSLEDEGSAQFAKQLVDMSAADFAKINTLYSEKQKIADELSKELYANEAQIILDSMTESLANLATSAYDYGAQTAQQFSAGFTESMQELGFNVLYNQVQAAGANRNYENYQGTSQSPMDLKLTVDVSGKSNVYLDSKVVGESVTAYQSTEQYRMGG